MIRKLLTAIVVLALVIGGATYFYYESAIRRGIEIAGSRVLGVEVQVQGVTLSPFSGRGTISGLTIANPPEFGAPYAVQLDNLEIVVNTDTLFSDVVEIESVLVEAAQVTYETRLVTDNIRTLIANIPSGPRGEQPSAETGGSTQVIIRDFRMIAPQVNVGALGISAPIRISDVHLQNIGDQSNAVTVAQAAQQIFAELSTTLLTDGALTESVRQGIQEGARQLENRARELSDGIRDVFSNGDRNAN